MITYDDRARKIGERIKHERSTRKISAKDFLPQIYKSETSYKTLANWESGKSIPDLVSLARMAEIFECDIGYLLGDYDEKSHVTRDIKVQTGLSEEAIIALQNMNLKQIATTVLSSLLVQPEVDQWLFQIYRIAGETSACQNLREASIAERFKMENKRLTTQAEQALESVAVPELESAELQEFKRHNKIVEGVISDLCSTDENVKEYGIGGAKSSITAYRAKYKLEEKDNG